MMKPVIKKQVDYRILLMRDDMPARTLHIHPILLRVCVAIFFLLLLGGAAGIAGGVHYWKKYHDLSAQTRDQAAELAEARLHLEHYVNKEAIDKARINDGTSQPRTKNEEIGAEARAQKALQAAANATIGQPGAVNATSAVPSPPPADAQNATEPPPPAGNGTSQNPTWEAFRISSEGSPVRVSNFSGRSMPLQRLHINYELSAQEDEQGTLSGQVRYIAVFTNGTRLPLDIQRSGDSRFSLDRVTHMKVMEGDARLPQTYQMKDVEGIDVILDMDGNATYYDRYPFSR